MGGRVVAAGFRLSRMGAAGTAGHFWLRKEVDGRNFLRGKIMFLHERVN